MIWNRRQLLRSLVEPAGWTRAVAALREEAAVAGIALESRRCLAWRRTICSVCAERCAENAIVFSGLFAPRVHDERCTGCGDCVAVCPAGALHLAGATENPGSGTAGPPSSTGQSP